MTVEPKPTLNNVSYEMTRSFPPNLSISIGQNDWPRSEGSNIYTGLLYDKLRLRIAEELFSLTPSYSDEPESRVVLNEIDNLLTDQILKCIRWACFHVIYETGRINRNDKKLQDKTRSTAKRLLMLHGFVPGTDQANWHKIGETQQADAFLDVTAGILRLQLHKACQLQCDVSIHLDDMDDAALTKLLTFFDFAPKRKE